MTDKTIDIPIYDCKLRVIITKPKKLNEQLKEVGYKGRVKGCNGIALRYPDTPQYYTMALTTKADAGTIAHESLHMVINIMRDVDIAFDYDNSEPMTYLLQFIVDCVTKIKEDDNN